MIKMENKRVVKQMTWAKDSFVQPSMIEYNMGWQARNWEKETQDMAVRLWQQAVLMPNLTGRELLNIATGRWTVNIIDTPNDTHYTVEFIEVQEEEE